MYDYYFCHLRSICLDSFIFLLCIYLYWLSVQFQLVKNTSKSTVLIYLTWIIDKSENCTWWCIYICLQENYLFWPYKAMIYKVSFLFYFLGIHEISWRRLAPGTLERLFSFPTSAFPCRTKQCLQPIVKKLKMIWNFDEWRFIDVLWAFLASCFFGALCFHKILPHLFGMYESRHLVVIFQDLIRYGKTKKMKREPWLVVFDVPKRYARCGNASL